MYAVSRSCMTRTQTEKPKEEESSEKFLQLALCSVDARSFDPFFVGLLVQLLTET